jgi:hypothetical protein
MQAVRCVHLASVIGLLLVASVAAEQPSGQRDHCRWNPKRIDPAFETLARETGGQVIALNPCDKRDAASVALEATLGTSVLSVNDRLAGEEKTYTFGVEPSTQRVSVSATGVRRLRVERADGTMVAGGTEGVQHAKTLNGEVWIVDDPLPGIWTVRARGAGEVLLRVNASGR